MHDLGSAQRYPPGFPAVTQGSTRGLNRTRVIARREIKDANEQNPASGQGEAIPIPSSRHPFPVIPSRVEGPLVAPQSGRSYEPLTPRLSS
jgi:hypothetical protein